MKKSIKDTGAVTSASQRTRHNLKSAASSLSSNTTGALAPIQRTVWKWNNTTKDWDPKDPKKVFSRKPIFIRGYSDGEEFDDGIDATYKQSSDPTVIPYLTGGDKFMGEKGGRKQLSGQKPKSSEIRVPAKNDGNMFSGSGMHEIIPTNMAPNILNNPVLSGLQSGMRSRTDLTFFNRTTDKNEKGGSGKNEIGAHTGAFPKVSGKGSEGTKGQAKGHDNLRTTTNNLKKRKKLDEYEGANELMLTHLSNQPKGQDFLKSEYITGMQSNIKSIGTIGPVNTKDPNRIRLAQVQHEIREKSKSKVKALKQQKDRGRSPSPERFPIQDDGSGGEYFIGPQPKFLPISIPIFDGEEGSFEHSANLSSWITQDYRTAPVFSNTNSNSGSNLTKRAPQKTTKSSSKDPSPKSKKRKKRK